MTTRSDSARFWQKVDRSGACWLWLAAKTGNGYGKFWSNGSLSLAHRFAFEQAHGPIGHGLTLDHLCRNRACVNPDHLEPVTLAVNLARSDGISAENARKTHCPQHHAYTAQNTYITPTGGRACRACRRERAALRRAARKEAS